jgi:hypothetical protein
MKMKEEIFRLCPELYELTEKLGRETDREVVYREVFKPADRVYAWAASVAWEGRFYGGVPLIESVEAYAKLIRDLAEKKSRDSRYDVPWLDLEIEQCRAALEKFQPRIEGWSWPKPVLAPALERWP